MKTALIEMLTEVLNMLFTLLAMGQELLECIADCIVVFFGFKLVNGRLATFYVKHFLSHVLWDFRMKTMKNLIYFRIYGHTVTLVLHIYHLIAFEIRLKELLPTHPELQELNDLYFRYLTMWNLTFQIFYASLSLACDWSSVSKQKHIVPDWLRRYRYTLFSGLLWPFSWYVLMFWPIYLYRKEYMTKPGFELAITNACNLDFHAMLLVYSLWELIFLPKASLKYRTRYAFLHTISASCLYIIIIFYTKYVDPKIWIYNILNYLDGTIYLYLLIASLPVPVTLAFVLQGQIKMYLWRQLAFAKKNKTQ